MENNKKISIKLKDIIKFAIVIVVLIFAISFYKTHNFNDFVKAESNVRVSKFERDTNVKCTEENSYKITNPKFNDAMFFETVDVTPNTSYRVTCKIKTQDVKRKDEYSDSGAHICISGTTEKSDNVIGTTDWTEVTFYFNSKGREKVDIGFRLGGFEDECTGTAWFSDFKIEAGIPDTTNTWNFLCVIFDYVDVDINGQNIKLRLTSVDKDDISVCMRRFQTSMQELSGGKMNVNYDIEEVIEPIKHFSYDEDTGFFVSGYDVKDVLDKYVEQGKYDHIFVVFRTGSINEQGAIPTNDWIGLGYMEYRNIGFSNIRLPDDDRSYLYKYDSRINMFPEEVMVHEFLHTLERNAEEYGEERPALHDYQKFGYNDEKLYGQKDWYTDYMNHTIKTNTGYVGLPEDIYNKKPAKTTDFEYAHEIKAFKEPQNLIEEIRNIFNRVKNLFSTIQTRNVEE